MSDRAIRELERDVVRGLRSEVELAAARFRRDSTPTFYDLLWRAHKATKLHIVRVPLPALAHTPDGKAGPQTSPGTLCATLPPGCVAAAAQIGPRSVWWGRFPRFPQVPWHHIASRGEELRASGVCLRCHEGRTATVDYITMHWGELVGVRHPETFLSHWVLDAVQAARKEGADV